LKINLPDVTLLAISSIEIPTTIQALQMSAEKLNFAEIKLISHEKPESLPKEIKYEYCPKITSSGDFDIYAFEELGKHIETSHMLMIQYHGFVIRPWLWDNEWLKYDFIGAPWYEAPEFISLSTGEMVRVGNGGFSLRSKKLLDMPKKLGIHTISDRGYTNDDGLINSYYRKLFLENGIVYPDVHVAAVFSHENDVPENKGIPTFGFHRYPKYHV
jgi:hypothetical protein